MRGIQKTIVILPTAGGDILAGSRGLAAGGDRVFNGRCRQGRLVGVSARRGGDTMRALGCILIGLPLLAAPASAASFLIRPDGSGDFPTIQAALEVAADGDTVLLANGIFLGEGNRDLDFHGRGLTLRSAAGSADSCAIDCQGSEMSPHRAAWFHGDEDSTAAIEDLTILRGWVPGNGGAILHEPLTEQVWGPRVSRCVFRENHARAGGAIAVGATQNSYPTIFRITNCLFARNSASTAGGAIQEGPGPALQIVSCRFDTNSANVAGGAIARPWDREGTVEHSQFHGNSAPLGGAIDYATGYYVARDPGTKRQGGHLVNGCVFASNSAQRGGAVSLGVRAAPMFTGCDFSDNEANDGGALFCARDGWPDFVSCVFAGNSALRGGALFMDTYTDNPFESRNPAFTNCSLVGNEAGSGSAFHTRVSPYGPRFTGCIIAFGRGGPAATCELGGKPALSCCDIYGNTGGDWVGTIADQLDLSGNFSRNPLFCGAGENPLLLAANSPCLPGAHPAGATCDLIGARGAGCGSLSYAPTRVCLVPGGLRRVHPGTPLPVTLQIRDAQGQVVPDEGAAPTLDCPGVAGELSPLLLRAQDAWEWNAIYLPAVAEGRETLVAHDPEASLAPYDTLRVEVTASAIVESVRDITGDQGRQVRVQWQSDLHDTSGASLSVIEYVVWRRVDDPAKAARCEVRALADLVASSRDFARSAGGEGLLAACLGALWEPVGPRVPAMMWERYASVVPTLGDSTAAGIVWSVFFVSAHTPVPQSFFVSAPDSGYSVDNLPPASPGGLAAGASYAPEGLAVVWAQSTEEDFAHYAVYRGMSGDFVPAPANRVGTPTVPGFFDSQWRAISGYHYKISAIDIHANESGFALMRPDEMTGVDARGDANARLRLLPNHPNPFNPRTTFSYGLAEAGRVRLRIYDARGGRVATLADAEVPAGERSAEWDGRDDRGAPMPSGVYFARLEGPSGVRTVKVTLAR